MGLDEVLLGTYLSLEGLEELLLLLAEGCDDLPIAAISCEELNCFLASSSASSWS